MNDLRPELLELAAAWLDTYDKMASVWANQIDPIVVESIDLLREVVNSTEVQDDLRRWAHAIRVGGVKVEFDGDGYYIKLNGS